MVRPKQITDVELLDVALKCFLEHGHNVSAQVIADKVGLSQPALFKRFGTKEELLLRAIAPPENLPALDWIKNAPIKDDFKSQIRRLIVDISEVLNAMLPRVKLLQDAKIPRGVVMVRYKTPPPVMIVRLIIGFFERGKKLELIRQDTNPGLIAQWIFGVVMGKSFIGETMSEYIGNQSSSDSYDEIVDTLCNGILS